MRISLIVSIEYGSDDSLITIALVNKYDFPWAKPMCARPISFEITLRYL